MKVNRTVVTFLLGGFGLVNVFAGSATWNLNPASGNWNHAANWTPQTIPNDISDTATFASSNITDVSISALETDVDGIVFSAGASAFTINVSPPISSNFISLVFWGVGITDNSGIAQKFVTAVTGAGDNGIIHFFNNSSAGNATFTNNGATSSYNGGFTDFSDTSTAANGTFTNNGGAVYFALGGGTGFSDTSTAANGTFTNNGGAVNEARGGITNFGQYSTAANGTFINNGGAGFYAFGGETLFFYYASAGNATFTNNGGAIEGARGGVTNFGYHSTAANGTFTTNGATVSNARGGKMTFTDWSTAGNAVLVANGGLGGSDGGGIFFSYKSHGGTARVEVFDNGYLDISSHGFGSVRIGSLEGNGLVFLGGRNLTVGTNNLSTIFSGVMQDYGQNGGCCGSLTKVGTGTLTLSNANTYSTYQGGTTINRGKIVVTNTSGSATGSGPLQVNHGRLAGTGKIAGAVTMGTGTGRGAFLSAGASATTPGTLTIQSRLTFNSDATYSVQLNSTAAKADKVVANGVTINSGAQFTFADVGSGTLTADTVFTVINNNSAAPIAGTFSNLPDGSTFTNNGNSYKVSYEGGDGNDLTLTVQ
jgi:autotransporter-associated beta strand protein